MASIFLPSGSYIDTTRGTLPPVLRYYGTAPCQCSCTCCPAKMPRFYPGDADDDASYTKPDAPKPLVPADVLFPGIALTKAARIARAYLRRKAR